MDTWTIFESMYWNSGLEWIAGVDEAGVGPLAGPVVAAACIIPRGVFFEGINDSKQLNQEQREELFARITRHPQVVYALGSVEAAEIDKINILQASLKAMHIAVQGLSKVPQMVLVDGNRTPTWSYPSRAIVDGDCLSQSIAAASILAKVTRDARMVQEDLSYPGYGLAAHKGYATKAHIRAIKELGLTSLHRHTFRSERIQNLFSFGAKLRDE